MSPPCAVTLKLATSLDGRIATQTGESRWITGPQAREQVHRQRASHDAVLVGVGTALADDPELNVRLDGYAGPQPMRAVADSAARTPLAGKLVAGAASMGPDGWRAAPVCVVVAQSAFESPAAQALADHGVIVAAAHTAPEGGLAPAGIIAALASAFASALNRGALKSVYLEGGGLLAASFLRAGLVDRIEWFRAPIVLGSEARSGVGPLALAALAQAPRFRRLSVCALGDDLLETYVRSEH